MLIVDLRHKGLARLYSDDDGSRLDARMLAKLRLQLAFLDAMTQAEELSSLPMWRPHRLSDGRWSFHVTANWRLTFRVDDGAGEISELDLEDYH